ncbi:MAG: 4-(cytidine 5'-diphospho)-2-C-methyl-D-erythritol kinase [Candidatus Kapaibacterium sp.]
MLSIAAYAKINLGLEVLHKRPDGYHEINTVFTRVSLHDTITTEHDDVISVRCLQLPDLNEHDNIVWKAAIALKQRFSVQSGAKITIHKHIPSGAGLGGGSSDAASALLALRKQWGLHCSTTELHEIAATLGADVPFFLGSGDAAATGIGDVLSPLSLSIPLTALLVFPGISVSTPKAYSLLRRDNTPRSGSDLLAAVPALQSATSGKVDLPNDFEQPVFAEYPVLGSIMNELRGDSCRAAFMSGSGSTLVALYDTQSEALHRAAALASVRSCVCSFVHHVEDDFRL